MYKKLKLVESENKKLKEGSTEEYWDATEIARDGFMSLMKFNFGTDSKGNNYIITVDANDVKRFSATSDDEAIEIYNKFKENWDNSDHADLTMDVKPIAPRNESAKLTEADDDIEDLKDKAEEDLENQEELEDTVDSEEDQEENPIEEESELDKELNELRDILVDLDLNLYQITDKEDLNNSIYIIGKVAEDSDDVLMLVDTKPEEVNSEEIPEEEPIIDNIDTDNIDTDNINEAEDNSNDLEKAKKIIENCGFTIQDEDVNFSGNETGWEIQQYTPEGEDWFVDIIVNNDVNKLIDEISSYAENFDVDEEVEPYIEMRGQRGVPSSISDLIKDAEWKKDQLINLSNELQKLKSGNINESAELAKVLRNPENSNERVEINKLPNGKYQTLYYSDEKSFSGAQSQFDDLDSAIKQAQKLRPTYKLEEAEEIDLENNEETEEDEHKTELEQRFDFVKLPNTFDEVNKLNPRYGEELTPDHEAIVEYLMNCLIEINPEAAEELQNNEEPEETPIEPDEDIDLDIDINGEEDLENED